MPEEITKEGWIKLFRKLKNNPIYKDSEAVHLFIHLLLSANHKDGTALINLQPVPVKRGQVVVGRHSIKKATGISERKIRTRLELLKNIGILTIQTTNRFSIVTISNYDEYQNRENETDQQTDQQTTSRRPAGDQQATTNKNDKNGKNVKNGKKNTDTSVSCPSKPDAIPFNEIISYLNEQTGKKYRNIPKTQELIRARWREGFNLDDFKTVIEKKSKEWMGDDKMETYLRPLTLFGSKFEGYLNQPTEEPLIFLPLPPSDKPKTYDFELEDI